MALNSKNFHDVVLRGFEKAISATFVGTIYTAFFRQMTIKELQMACIQPEYRILHVGCGSVPNTLLILAEALPASYVGIDRDGVAVGRARNMVQQYGLEQRVTIEEDDALAVDYSSFDLIILSLGVEPREAILAAMCESMKSDAKIVTRKPWDFMDRLYGRKEFIPQGFCIVDVFHRPDFIKSMLLVPVGR